MINVECLIELVELGKDLGDPGKGSVEDCGGSAGPLKHQRHPADDGAQFLVVIVEPKKLQKK